MSETRTRGPSPSPDAAHEIADVERALQTTDGVYDVDVSVRAQSARLYWDTWETNEALRSRVLAFVCTDIATSDHWALVSVHDPMERENQRISNAVTLRREGDDGE